jgi:hypothetical protein
MRAEAEPKPRRRRNESARGARVARVTAWVGPRCQTRNVSTANEVGPRIPFPTTTCVYAKRYWVLQLDSPVVDADAVDQTGPEIATGGPLD